MTNQELVTYVQARKQQGASQEVIINELKGAGWSDEDLSGLFDTPEPEMGSGVPSNTQAAENPPVIQRIPTGAKMGKFKASWMIVKASWNLLKQDKEMMWFPILAFFANLTVLVFFILGIFIVGYQGDFTAVSEGVESSSESGSIAWYVSIFVLYIISYFITVYSEIGIVAIAHGRVAGQDLSFKDGMNAASSRTGKIFMWAVLAATVGMILRTIAERSKLLGRIVVWMMGAMWSILSYFIVPVLFLEDLSLKDSLKKSAQTINTNWGEAAIVNVGVSAVFGILGLIGFIVTIVTGVVLSAITESVLIMATAGVLFIVYIIALGIISSTLGTIFKMVLYEYATTRTIPQGFSEELFAQAFKGK